MNERILVVEDEAITALDLKYSLKEKGYDVIDIVDNGEEAIELASKKSPDIVLMDIKLKGSMEGTEAASIICDMNIPIVYLTANSDKETFQQTKIKRYYGFIKKPYDITHLDKTLKITMDKFQMETKSCNLT